MVQELEKPAFPEPPSLMPTRRRTGFWIKDAQRERSHAQTSLSCEHGEHPLLDAGSRMAQASCCDGLRVLLACFAGGSEVTFPDRDPSLASRPGTISRADLGRAWQWAARAKTVPLRACVYDTCLTLCPAFRQGTGNGSRPHEKEKSHGKEETHTPHRVCAYHRHR